LEFVSYKLGDVRYDVKECVQKGMTYAAPLKIVVRLVVFEADRPAESKGNGEAAETKQIRDIKEQEVYFGEIPLMTETVRSSLTGRSGLLSISSIARRVSFSTMTRGKLSPAENSFTRPESFPFGDLGWI